MKLYHPESDAEKLLIWAKTRCNGPQLFERRVLLKGSDITAFMATWIGEIFNDFLNSFAYKCGLTMLKFSVCRML